MHLRSIKLRGFKSFPDAVCVVGRPFVLSTILNVADAPPPGDGSGSRGSPLRRIT